MDRVQFIVPWYVQEVSHRATELLLRVPRDATDSQNYIAACDLVVTKPGYSTVSEAILGRVPMLTYQREGFSEDDAIIDAVEDLGIGHRIDSIQALKSLDLEAACAMRAAYDHLPDRYRRDGNLEAAERILELL